MFKRLMYNKIIEVLNLNTQTIYSQLQKKETTLPFEGGYLIGLYPNGIPYIRKQLDTNTAYSWDRVEVIPVSEVLSEETPSVNASDRSDYVFSYQMMFRVDLEDEVEGALDEFRTYFFNNKQFTLDGYKVSVKTTRANKLGTVSTDTGQFYAYYSFTVYATAIKNGYMKQDTDKWQMALSTGFGNSVVVTSLTVGTAYEITVLGTTDFNVVFGTTGVTYSVGDTGVAVALGTGTGVVKITYQDLIVIEDIFSMSGNVNISNATGVGKGQVTTTVSNNRLQIVYTGTTLEKKLYEVAMNKVDKDTEYKMVHTFDTFVDGDAFTYQAKISNASRVLTDNGVIILVIDWIEAD